MKITMTYDKINVGNKIKSNNDLIDYYLQVIDYRNTHKSFSADIARFAFDQTHPNVLAFVPSKELYSIRFEFGSLEAPDMPDDEHLDMTPKVYCDYLWNRLQKIILQEKNKKG